METGYLWDIEGLEGLQQLQQQLDTVPEHVQTHFSSLPTPQEINGHFKGHFMPGSFNNVPAPPVGSPISLGSSSSGHRDSTGYSSSNFGSLPDAQISFDYVRPTTTTVPGRSLLTSKLRAQAPGSNDNIMLSPNQLYGSPIPAGSPGLPGSPMLMDITSPLYQNYSLPSSGMKYDQDAHISQTLESMGIFGRESISPSEPWFNNGHTGSVPVQPVTIQNNTGRHVRHSSTGPSASRSPYARSGLSPFTSMSNAPPLASTSMPAVGSFTETASMGAGFSLHQLPAAQRILDFIQTNPTTAIPAALITSELVETSEGRGHCLIGNCGRERAAQKASPEYDSSKDPSRKRVDHLYDHIRDKHFNCRPFQCTQCSRAFSRDHDLKRHESVHSPTTHFCGYCPRSYTREDNLKRHITQTHGKVPTQAIQIAHTNS